MNNANSSPTLFIISDSPISSRFTNARRQLGALTFGLFFLNGVVPYSEDGHSK